MRRSWTRQVIRPCLPTLAGDRAPEMDSKLRLLLQQAAGGRNVEEGSLSCCRARPTHNSAGDMLGDKGGLPPELQATRSAGFPACLALPGR